MKFKLSSTLLCSISLIKVSGSGKSDLFLGKLVTVL